MDTIQTEAQTLQSALADKLHSLAQRQTHITFGVLFVLIVFMSVAGFFGYRSLQSYDKLVAAAQKQTDDFKTERAEFKKALDAAQADREDITKQQDVIVKVVHDRDTSTDAAITKATAPDQDLGAIMNGVANAYKLYKPFDIMDEQRGDDTGILSHRISFPPQAVQTFTATKLDRDRLFSNWQDSQKNLGLEQDKNLSLAGSLAVSEKEAKDSEALATKWEHVAHKTKMRRFLDGLERGGEIVGTGYLAYEVGKAAGSHK